MVMADTVIFQEDGVLSDQIIKDYNLKEGSKILDVGCGKGYLLKELKSKIKGLNVFGFDISK